MIRVKKIPIYERDLMFTIGGQLFDQAPNRQPRKAEIIMQKVRDQFRKDAFNSNETFILSILEEDIPNYIDRLLKSIPEFLELNLSQIEYIKKMNLDTLLKIKEEIEKICDTYTYDFRDTNKVLNEIKTITENCENNSHEETNIINENLKEHHVFTSSFDKYDEDSWKSDIVDLDAFIRNVCTMLNIVMYSDQDCMGCKNINKPFTFTECKSCSLNFEVIKNNYQCNRKPKDKYTFSCRYDCDKLCMICCEECGEKETCDSACNGDSNTCGNKVEERPKNLSWKDVFNSQIIWPAEYDNCRYHAIENEFKYLAFNGIVYSVDDVDRESPICEDMKLSR